MLATTSSTFIHRIHRSRHSLHLLDILLATTLAMGLMLSVGALTSASVAAKSTTRHHSKTHKTKDQTWQFSIDGFGVADTVCKPNGVCAAIPHTGTVTFEGVTYTVTHTYQLQFSKARVQASGTGQGSSSSGSVTIAERSSGTGAANARYPNASRAAGAITFSDKYTMNGTTTAPVTTTLAWTAKRISK
jgi:hypothetical protein